MLRTILVALDASEASGQILDMLKTLKIEPRTKVILVHVLDAPATERQQAFDRPHASQESLYQRIEKQFQFYQANLGCESEIEIVVGDPAEEIVRLANIYQVDLIAIGTRGLKGLKRVLAGSVSSQVVSEASCSVLVVKPQPKQRIDE